MARTEQATQLNGVDTDTLVETIDAIRDAPDLARFRFNVSTEWLGGARCRTRIQEFYGAGQDDTTRTEPFVLEGDEPPALLGENGAPNAVETLLHALTSCLTVGFAYNAAARGIAVRSLELDARGELDLHGFLGLSDDVRPGYDSIRVSYRVDADAAPDEVDDLCDYVQRTSPVLDMLRNPVRVQVERE